MSAENELIQKLMISKKIMEKHKEMPRGQAPTSVMDLPSTPELKEFNVPQSTYNIPEEFMSESKIPKQPQTATKDKILSSKLPDEIKQLMIEHPISQPNNMSSPTLSNELVEKASRLMGTNSAGQQTKKPQPQQQMSGIDTETIKSIVRETVEQVLSENGLLIESTSKSNDVFSFKVGNHRFEGKVTKIVKTK
jgi:hypothetical protein